MKFKELKVGNRFRMVGTQMIYRRVRLIAMRFGSGKINAVGVSNFIKGDHILFFPDDEVERVE